jgi:diguanylate cyclase (GGDEF)-like protein/PAS domain S-box-containing protein
MPFNTIAQRFVGLLILTSVVPLCIVGALSYRVAHHVLREEATESQKHLVNSQRDYLDLQLRQIENLIYNLSDEEQIIEAVDPEISHNSVYLELATQARIGYILNKYTNLDGLVSIDIYSPTGRHFHVGDTLNVSTLRPQVKQRIGQQLKLSEHRDIVWVGVEDNINKNSKFEQVATVAKMLAVTDVEGSGRPIQREIGTLVINYNLDYFFDYFSQIDFGKKGYLVIFDSFGRIIYHPDKSQVGNSISQEFIASLPEQNSAFIRNIDGESMLIDYQNSTVSGWTIISFMPLQELLMGARLIRTVTLAATLVAFAVVAFAAFKVSKDLVSPIQRVTNHFRILQAGRVEDVDRLPADGNNEIGELSRGFNALLDSLQVKQEIETALRESEHRYSLALQGSNDGIWDWDLTRQVIHFSSRWQDMVNYPEQVIPQNLNDWLQQIHIEDVALVVFRMTEHLLGNLPQFEVEHRLLKYNSKEYIWVLVRGMATRNEEGRATRMAGSMTDITPRKAAEDKLRYDALHDVLTGLPNRNYFNQRLGEVLSNTQLSEENFSVLVLLDLDRFKVINDSLGHIAGDTLLVQSSKKLNYCLRAEDFSARLGGDEFAIILSDVSDVRVLEKIASKIQRELSSPVSLEGHQVSVSASLGITLITNTNRTAPEVLRDADTALYRAKDQGRAQYVIFDPSMYDKSLAVLKAETQLKQAIQNKEFKLFYQPIFSLKENRVMAVEALIRWQSPDQGFVSPEIFIPLAEELGLISTIGAWVIEEACQQGMMWNAAGYPHLKISVNVSARQLLDRELPEFIATTLKHTGLPAGQLQVEITESTAMANTDLTCQVLEQIQSMGVSVAIDDFGISYSSLGYLRQLPINSIKIDRSFIKDIPDNEDAVAITSAILAMARILDLAVTAEGVETPDQLNFLSCQACDYAQGYLFSRPLAADDLARLNFSQYNSAVPVGVSALG